jgi:thiamine-phosphate pyrophosphorylase
VTAQSGCQIYAVVEAGPGALERVEAALSATDLAALLIIPAGDAPKMDPKAAEPLVQAAARAGVAALVAADAQLARILKADGVHVPASKAVAEAYEEAREIVGPRAIVGADPGLSRHDAMALAEGGADYIAFGAPAHLNDRDKARARRDELVAWWGEIFQIPCVAFDVETADEAAALAAAGADFIGVMLPSGQPPAAIRDALAEIATAIRDAAMAS